MPPLTSCVAPGPIRAQDVQLCESGMATTWSEVIEADEVNMLHQGSYFEESDSSLEPGHG